MFRRFLLFFLFFTFLTPCFARQIQKSGLAGKWYTDNPKTLYKKINGYLRNASLTSLEGQPIAIISPHAGIIYSGETAAFGFEPLRGKGIEIVVVVGFSHKEDYDGIAVFGKKGISTPLGILYSDKLLINQITQKSEKIFVRNSSFYQENSVELILPFIQVALGNPKVLLLAIGSQSLDNSKILGEALGQILANKQDYLIIASTDMSHYLSDSETRTIDSKTAEIIKYMEPNELFLRSYGKNRMCGLASVVSTMIAAKKLGADKAQILNLSTSAIASGNKARTVGYLSAAFLRTKPIKEKERVKMQEFLNKEQRKKLISIARNTIKEYLVNKVVFEPQVDDPVLKQTMGVFVTLNKDGRLRGCIGNIIGTEKLYLSVRNMAIAASTEDSRFEPVTQEELSRIDIEISVLTPLRQISDPDEIIMGTHGVLVRDGFRSGVYLPQVATETGWSRDEFMNSLCRDKAHMEEDAWRTGKCEIHVFTAEVFGE